MAAMGGSEYHASNWADFCERLRRVVLMEWGPHSPGVEFHFFVHSKHAIILNGDFLKSEESLNFTALRLMYEDDQVVQTLLDILEHK